MSKEYAELMMLMLMNDVSEAQKWKEVKHNDAWKEPVNKMNKQIMKHQAKIEQATEDDFIQLQKQITEGSDSPDWFKAEDLRAEWIKFQDDLLKFQISRSLPVFRYILREGWDFEYTAHSHPYTTDMTKDAITNSTVLLKMQAVQSLSFRITTGRGQTIGF